MSDLREQMRLRLIDQDDAVDTIVPYIEMHQAGLAPEGRPVGVFMLLGPTGSGKTRTVEALAEVIHGSKRNMVKIDCGEFQMEHEVAKLIGAPPGYLGHRETVPMLNQAKINAAASENSPLTLVLFDEVEKAAPSLVRLLLGVLDKATLRLGDNSSVNFENCLIFMTSNLGADAIAKLNGGSLGFDRYIKKSQKEVDSDVARAGYNAARRKYSPEFCNRVDEFVTYKPLSKAAIDQIFDIECQNFARLIFQRIGIRSFRFTFSTRARAYLIDQGFSKEFGARELKRVLQRQVMQNFGRLLNANLIPPGCLVVVDYNKKQGLRFLAKDIDSKAA